LLLSPLVFLPQAAFADPLPSWNDTDAKAGIIAFVEGVTDPDADTYVTPGERIAVFDNDGTLWGEQPLYFQLLFALDRAKEMAAADPAWASTPALKAAAEGNMKSLMEGGEDALVEVISATHSGMSVAEFQALVADWIATATHPKTGRPYSEMVYQPMLELLTWLRDEDFATYIVSGGGVDFMRAFAEDVYGIPPEQVIGSMGKAKFEIIDGVPQVTKDPGIAFIDDKGGKPVGIMRSIGRRPIFVGGNSDGDLAMLQWSTAGEGARFGLIVHHTDAKREWAYDRDSHIGRLDKALNEAGKRAWTVVDMKRDWKVIYPAERSRK
jgi:hypothetical protein